MEISRIDMDIKLFVAPKKIVYFLLSLIFIIHLASLSMQTLHLFVNSKSSILSALAKIFSVNQEGNLPSLYSSMSLLFCSFLLGIITFAKKNEKDRYAFHWGALSLIFLFLSWDEAVEIHEKLSFTPLAAEILNFLGVQKTGIFAFSWIVIAMPLVFLMGLAYVKFFLSLSFLQKRLLLSAISLFLFGAIGMEMVGGLIFSSFSKESLPYIISTGLEELFEMLGVAVFIYALLLQLNSSAKEVKFIFDNRSLSSHKKYFLD